MGIIRVSTRYGTAPVAVKAEWLPGALDVAARVLFPDERLVFYCATDRLLRAA
jgi:hypothetical protein